MGCVSSDFELPNDMILSKETRNVMYVNEYLTNKDNPIFNNMEDVSDIICMTIDSKLDSPLRLLIKLNNIKRNNYSKIIRCAMRSHDKNLLDIVLLNRFIFQYIMYDANLDYFPDFIASLDQIKYLHLRNDPKLNPSIRDHLNIFATKITNELNDHFIPEISKLITNYL